MQIVNQTPLEPVIDLKFYIRVISKGKWKIIAFEVLVTLLVTIYVFSLPPIYRATSSLLIKANQENTVSIDSVISLDTSRKDYFSTPFEITSGNAEFNNCRLKPKLESTLLYT